MPRIARLDTPGLLHHVMIRGIERRKIFNDDKDRENLIERLSTLLPESKTQCYAWAVSELVMDITDLATAFGMTPSALGRAVVRGGQIAKEGEHRLGA
jgi:hypothetical protein